MEWNECRCKLYNLHQIHSKLFRQILNAKLFKIIAEDIEENWQALGFGQVGHEFWVLTHNTKRQSTKKNKEYHGLCKIQDFYFVEGLRKIKWQVRNREKNICKQTFNKGFVAKYTRNSNSNNPKKIGKALNKHLIKGTQIVHKTMPRMRRQRNNSPA